MDYALEGKIYWKVSQHFRFWPNLDLFPNAMNGKCRRFYSWRPDPRAVAVDAFAQSWSAKGDRPLFNPPWAVIPAALRKLKEEQALVLAILPVWKTRFWWG